KKRLLKSYGTVHASLKMLSPTFPSSVGEKYSSPLSACRRTDGSPFSDFGTQPINSHSARSHVPKLYFIGLMWNRCRSNPIFRISAGEKRGYLLFQIGCVYGE